MSELNYQIWDTKETFSIEQAVFLWQDKEPPSYRWLCDECLKNKASIHPIVAYGSETGRVIAELIERHVDMSNLYQLTRDELIEVAQKVGMKPKFLFPEERKSLDKRERDSYLGVIAALLRNAGIVKDSDAAGKVQAILQTDGSSLDQKTIRKILGQLPKRE